MAQALSIPRGEIQREQWGSRSGFLLAAIGCAVGLGNVWRFPYTVAEYGGAAFVLVYLGLTAAVGVPLLLAELSLGRRAKAGPVRALEELGGRPWRFVGWGLVGGVALMLASYAVIGGWTLRYAASYFAGLAPSPAGAFFAQTATGSGAALAMIAFLTMTTAIVARGIRGGIERLARGLVPLLVMCLAGLALFGATLEEGRAAYGFLFRPDLAPLLRLETWSHAAGQAFFSLSLGFGAMLTFGSYLQQDLPLGRTALTIAGADLAVALLAGLAVFPLLFAAGGLGSGAEGAMGALFVAIPNALLDLGPLGQGLGLVFFLALAVGAWTSAVAMMEVVVVALVEATGVRRARCAWSVGAVLSAVGLLPAYDLAALGWMDLLVGEVWTVAGGLLLALFAGWVLRDPTREFLQAGRWQRGAWVVLLRVAVPAALALLLWGASVSAWGRFEAWVAA